MQWLRIDTYFEGDLAAPRAHFQPMACQHCENAPCEQVCPVGATVHTPEGLNTMVYNRCVGTRYCSNNCPYKVRRFNFLLYSDLRDGEPEADAQSRCHGPQPRRDGEVHLLRAAHQRGQDRRRQGEPRRSATAKSSPPASRPARPQAITFGNLNDPTARSQSCKADRADYGVLADLNTRPRTTYVAEVLNPTRNSSSAGGASHRREELKRRRWQRSDLKNTMRAAAIDPATGEYRGHAPGHTFKSVTEKISAHRAHAAHAAGLVWRLSAWPAPWPRCC